jgi:hypothetical protein
VLNITVGEGKFDAENGFKGNVMEVESNSESEQKHECSEAEIGVAITESTQRTTWENSVRKLC